MSELSLALDVVLAVLLFAMIAYAAVLNKRLDTLRESKSEMENLAQRLVESTQHAEKGLADLKNAANETGNDLSKRVEEARKLADDLRFLVDKGSGLADRLEKQVTENRETGTASPASGRPQTGKRARKSAAATGQARESGSRDTGTAPARAETDGGSGSSESGGGQDVPPSNTKLARALKGVR